MTESQFFTALKGVLDDGFAARSIQGVSVIQADQPRIQGASSGMLILMNKINLHAYGYPKVREEWQFLPSPGFMRRTESQQYEISIQLMGQVKQPTPPAKLLPLTAGDILKTAGRILQSVQGCSALRAAGIGTQRLMQMPQSYFKDDSDAFAQSPNFTLVFTFTDTETLTIPITTKTELNILGV